MHKTKHDIKALADSKGVRMWMIAERYGLHESNFSRKLRHPLSEADRAKIVHIIHEIADSEV